MPLPIILFVVFLVLKLCEVIAWSWWWVTSPLWISFILALIVFVFAFFFAKRRLKMIRESWLFNGSV
jgi:hypothetical protein